MKNYLLSIFFFFALAFSAIGQVTFVDFDAVQDPFIEPFNLDHVIGVANPDGTGLVGKVTKYDWAPWGGINVYFGGDVVFTGSNDKFSVDFYTDATPLNDTIRFQFQLFPRNSEGGAATIDVNGYYVHAGDATLGTWKTIEFPVPDGTTGIYNQMVIFFGWDAVGEGEVVYYDNIVAPGYSAYGNTDVTFNITDKFNNATDVKLFIDGTEETLSQTDNVYSVTKALASYNVTVGESQGISEIVYSHMANGAEVRDTVKNVLIGNSAATQELLQFIIVEAPEDGTALAISVGDTPPTIDGTIDDVWYNAKTHTMQERSWWGSPTGMYSTWKVMWDIDNVYFLYTVEDATPYNANPNNYENDCVEAFFDMNQSAGAYDADDWQIRTTRGLDTWTGSANANDTWAADLERAQSEMANSAGYIIEMAIPWSSLSSSFLPLATVEFNYDCLTADVGASGGTPLYKESWTTAVDEIYYNTEYFGTITLSDATNEGIVVLSNNIISENNSINDFIGTFSSMECAGSCTFSLAVDNEGNDNSYFLMDGNNLMANAVFDKETRSSYQVRIKIEDQTRIFYENFSIIIPNVNESPTDIEISNYYIDENQEDPYSLGLLTAIDEDVSDTHTFILVSGNGINDSDNSSFTIDGNVLKTNEIFDYETQQNCNIYVQAVDADGATYEKAFTVMVNDVNETPTDIELSNNTIDENQASGSVVSILTAIDQDDNDTHTFILISSSGSDDADNSSFTIDGNILKTNTVLDYETQQDCNIYVQAVDAAGASYEKAFVIQVNDLTETGIEDVSESIAVFPNPSNGKFSIGFNSNEYNVKIYDAIGNLIFQEKSKNQNLNVDLEGIVSGVCFIVIEGKDSIAYKKIIIQ